jgi:START domain
LLCGVHISFASCLCSSCIFDNAYCQGSWQIKKDKDGIQVFSRSSANSKFNELRVLTTMDGTLSALAAVLLDVNDHGEWVYGTKSSVLLKQVSPSELFFYTEVSAPWPAANRDLPVQLTISQSGDSKVMNIIANDVPNFIPSKSGIVRVPTSKAIWNVIAVGNGKIQIDYQLSIDIGGAVPAWMFNMFCAKAPYESFKALKKQVLLPKYANASLAFIRN